MDKLERKIVLILAPDPEGHDMPQAAIARLRALKAEGYRVTEIPADGDALMCALLAADAEETFQRGDYGIYFANLPRALQDRVTARWGAPERDPAFRESRLDCGAFAIRAARFGNVVVALEPPRGDETGIGADGASSDRPPPHGYLAFYAWIADGLRAQAIVHLAKECIPDATVCAVPPLG